MFIVLDGPDGVGKSTQVAILAQRLRDQGYSVSQIKFPNYPSRIGQVIQDYLQAKVKTANIYQASTCYALDRALAFQNEYKFAMDADFVVCDRYLSSNLIHQLPLLPEAAWSQYISWLTDFEFRLLESPQPDLTIILTLEYDVLVKQLQQRTTDLDVIESDKERTRKSLQVIQLLACYGYQVLDCTNTYARTSKSITEVSDMIYSHIKSMFPRLVLA